jgi:hypothetical protein
MPFKLSQCFERVPFHGKEADRVIITGSFDCPDGRNSSVTVELRITAPPAAVSSWSGDTGAGFPSFDIAGFVAADFPAWAKHMCGQEITFEVRGFCGLTFTPWETFQKVVVGPRSDDGRRAWSRKVDGDMHVPPNEYQPAKRWYPGTLDELLWCVQNRHENPRSAGIPGRSTSCCGACRTAMKRMGPSPRRTRQRVTGRSRTRR